MFASLSPPRRVIINFNQRAHGTGNRPLLRLRHPSAQHGLRPGRGGADRPRHLLQEMLRQPHPPRAHALLVFDGRAEGAGVDRQDSDRHSPEGHGAGDGFARLPARAAVGRRRRPPGPGYRRGRRPRRPLRSAGAAARAAARSRATARARPGAGARRGGADPAARRRPETGDRFQNRTFGDRPEGRRRRRAGELPSGVRPPRRGEGPHRHPRVGGRDPATHPRPRRQGQDAAHGAHGEVRPGAEAGGRSGGDGHSRPHQAVGPARVRSARRAAGDRRSGTDAAPRTDPGAGAPSGSPGRPAETRPRSRGDEMDGALAEADDRDRRRDLDPPGRRLDSRGRPAAAEVQVLHRGPRRISKASGDSASRP